jgi:hypothetical protein
MKIRVFLSIISFKRLLLIAIIVNCLKLVLASFKLYGKLDVALLILFMEYIMIIVEKNYLTLNNNKIIKTITNKY